MAGSYKGAAALTKAIFPFALYFHCAIHRLYLCVQNTCSVQMVQNSMDSIKDISYLFNLSPKRQGCLEQYVQKHDLSVSKEDVSLEDENTNENDPGEDIISNKKKMFAFEINRCVQTLQTLQTLERIIFRIFLFIH